MNPNGKSIVDYRFVVGRVAFLAIILLSIISCQAPMMVAGGTGSLKVAIDLSGAIASNLPPAIAKSVDGVQGSAGSRYIPTNSASVTVTVSGPGMSAVTVTQPVAPGAPSVTVEVAGILSGSNRVVTVSFYDAGNPPVLLAQASTTMNIVGNTTNSVPLSAKPMNVTGSTVGHQFSFNSNSAAIMVFAMDLKPGHYLVSISDRTITEKTYDSDGVFVPFDAAGGPGAFLIYAGKADRYYFVLTAKTKSSGTLSILARSTAFGSTLVGIPAGIFQRDATPTNTSYVSAFFMSPTEVSGNQYQQIVGTNPSNSNYYTNALADPVEQVSWYDALVYCNKLSIAEGLAPVYTIKGSTDPAVWGPVPTSAIDAQWDAAVIDMNASGYRLPTEMEWMWAAMGADTANPGAINTTGWQKEFAGDPNPTVPGDVLTSDVWYSVNAGLHTQIAGTKAANELGLKDMSGNVFEWCSDWYAPFPSGGLVDFSVSGPMRSSTRAYHGGAFDQPASVAAITLRTAEYPYKANYDIGFRVVRR